MISESALIAAIRRRVQDPDEGPANPEGRPLYSDDYYRDAIRRAVRWVNIRFGTAYTYVAGSGDIEDIPEPHDYYVELRATVEMCFVRAGEGGTNRIDDASTSRTLEVPNLRIENQLNTKEGTAIWRRLAAALMEELEGLIDLSPDLLPEVGMGLVSRISTLTNRRTNRPLDGPLPAPSLTSIVTGPVVALVWSNVKSHRFCKYEVERSADPSFTSTKVVFVSHDNHVVQYNDTPGVGTFRYRVKVYNDNHLWAASNTVTSEVG